MSECAKCSVGGTLLSIFSILVCFTAALAFVYRLSNAPLAAEMSPALSLSISVGVTLSMLQGLGILSSMAMSFDSPVKEILASMKILVFLALKDICILFVVVCSEFSLDFK